MHSVPNEILGTISVASNGKRLFTNKQKRTIVARYNDIIQEKPGLTKLKALDRLSDEFKLDPKLTPNALYQWIKPMKKTTKTRAFAKKSNARKEVITAKYKELRQELTPAEATERIKVEFNDPSLEMHVLRNWCRWYNTDSTVATDTQAAKSGDIKSAPIEVGAITEQFESVAKLAEVGTYDQLLECQLFINKISRKVQEALLAKIKANQAIN